jgi:hypothetical protein
MSYYNALLERQQPLGRFSAFGIVEYMRNSRDFSGAADQHRITVVALADLFFSDRMATGCHPERK